MICGPSGGEHSTAQVKKKAAGEGRLENEYDYENENDRLLAGFARLSIFHRFNGARAFFLSGVLARGAS